MIKFIKYGGLAIFFVGLLVLVGMLGMSDYKITDSVLQQSIGNEAHLKAISSEISPMMEKVYDSKFTFLSDLSDVINKANSQLDQSNKIYDYNSGVYQLNIIKNASIGPMENHVWLFFILSIGFMVVGGLIFIIPHIKQGPPGIKNDHIFHRRSTRGKWVGLGIGLLLIAFYIFIYWYPQYIANWIRLVDPLSKAISGGPASQWFFYGFLYTLAVLVMGVRMFIKYRHSRYHLVRTSSVMFFQLGFAFLIPEILAALNQPYYDFKNIWPLDYDFFYGWQINTFLGAGFVGKFMLVWGILLIVAGVPLLTYFVGKRWYCSWVCGCGGLAETAGDPYRQLSDKSLKAWRIERWLVHSVLVFAVVMTGITLINYFSNQQLLGSATNSFQRVYGFAIGSVFAGVIGVGFYPFMGNRVWCRFGCPLAAYLGLVQRFKSRFRITTNGGQCISCGNCSTYCEMGIDVRWYAQRGQNIIRASCVGCGVCAAVCPRGVLRLENGKEKKRFNEPKRFKVVAS
jgi:ferredoxin-type protein NapH